MKFSRAQWISRCAKQHDNKYTYDQFPPNPKSSDRVKICCPLHGTFVQILDNHYRGKGCPVCGNISRGASNQKGRQHFIDKATLIHSNKYDYSQWPINVKDATKVDIICPLHGNFQQTLSSHVAGSGCPLCGKIKAKETIKNKYGGISSPRQTSIPKKTLELLNNKDWMVNQYTVLQKTTIEIGAILSVNPQTVSNYLQKHNIETNNLKTSLGERELALFCKEHVDNIITNSTQIIPPKELDIYIPSYKLAIEYCGLYWHSEQQGKDKHYHKNKYDLCKKQGIRLLTIFEDEWRDSKEIIKRKLLYMFNKSYKKVYARNTNVVLVDTNTKKRFFENNHIQGNGPGSINIGLSYEDNLVACISFIKQKNNTFVLNRYATSINVVGGFSKLLTFFQRKNKWKQIISFADLRWSEGTLYEKTGWKLDKVLSPDYYYSPPGGQIRLHKFNYRRKNLPNLLNHFDSKLSEKQNCDNNGILRIWDCGKKRYVLQKTS